MSFGRFILLEIDSQSLLFSHELGQVERKSVRVVETPSDIALRKRLAHIFNVFPHTRYDFVLQVSGCSLEETSTAGERLQKLSLFVVNNVNHFLRIPSYFRKGIALKTANVQNRNFLKIKRADQNFHNRVHQTAKHARRSVHLLGSKSNSATQNSSQNVAIQ